MTLTKGLNSFIIPIIFNLLLTACDGGSDSPGITNPENPLPDSETPVSPPKELSEIIEQLEKEGTIPELQRGQELAGIDTNENGIRDDIDSWIEGLDMSLAQQGAIKQQANAIQSTLIVDLTNSPALKDVANSLADAVNCMGKQFYNEGEGVAYNLIKNIEKITINTKQRAIQYEKYNQSRSGYVIKLPSGDSCHVL